MEYNHLNSGHELTVKGSIQKSRLQRNQYTLSLMNEGLRAGMLEGTEIIRINNTIMLLLQELIGKYTQGESTSVTTETAESLLTSLMYATDAYLLSLEVPEKAMIYLKKVDTREIYERGIKQVTQVFEETKRLYKEIKAAKLNIPVDAYNLTIDESLPVFLKKYGILFDAHNTMASIDYPLAIDDMRLQGVYYIKQYLERLKLESDFCGLLDQRELMELLDCYGRECRFNYRIELFNIFELVFNNVVFSLLSGGNVSETRISESQYKRLEQQFMKLTKKQLQSVISSVVKNLLQELPIRPNTKLMEYLEGCKEGLIQRVAHAAKNNSLRSVIITERRGRASSVVISFSEADRMSDIKLRKLLQNITACNRTVEKVKIITSSFRSLYDYLDLLESDILYGDEYEAVFDTYGDMELAILAKIVFYEELRSEALDLASILALANGYPMEWQMQFVRYLLKKRQEGLLHIEKMMSELDYEQMNFS